MTQPAPTAQALADARRDRIALRIRAAATVLTRLAAEASRVAGQVETGHIPDGTTHTDLAADLIQEILAGLANLHLGTIARVAAEADQAVNAAKEADR